MTFGQAAPQIRFDGLYYEVESAAVGEALHRYWRFAEDGSCLRSGLVKGAPSEAAPFIAKWLDKDHDRVEVGRYTLAGARLTCVTGDARAGSTYTAELTPTGFDVISPTGTTRWAYRFIQVDIPAAAAAVPGENRAPRIDDRVSRTNAFRYDAAGRVIGVTTTIEISATDAEGDVLRYEWTASVGTIVGDGPKGVWARPLDMGRPAAGAVTVVVTDSKNGSSSRTFTFQ
jgi:YD repeat-containing protein